ncbi:hypothetical protein, partial [Prochlorothrix hollandica]|uniref:hypothetical protein n=1 Tax=Prochlorothrix hollandica TaxID=1223 RepID=UPI00333E2FD7
WNALGQDDVNGAEAKESQKAKESQEAKESQKAKESEGQRTDRVLDQTLETHGAAANGSANGSANGIPNLDFPRGSNTPHITSALDPSLVEALGITPVSAGTIVAQPPQFQTPGQVPLGQRFQRWCQAQGCRVLAQVQRLVQRLQALVDRLRFR